MIFVNFKTYTEGSGENAVNLAKICQAVSQQTNVPIIPIVQALDVAAIKKEVAIPIFLQHIDPFPNGQFTGFMSVENAIMHGVSGTILNHSEHPLSMDRLQQSVEHIRKTTDQFTVIICTPNMEQIAEIKSLNPDFIAYEPPELIGSTTTSVATEQAAYIAEAVKATHPVPLIIGAGIHSKEDIKTSLALGSKGVLIATAVVLAQNPQTMLTEFAQTFTI